MLYIVLLLLALALLAVIFWAAGAKHWKLVMLCILALCVMAGIK